ncbi:MAG: hypothetical protein KGJ06_03380 [Pseudomonadota bacterium]|nr:hypothetical protein [Pseudomonadota bacterium]
MKSPSQRSIPKLAAAILDAEIYVIHEEEKLPPHTFRQYMKEEEASCTEGVSIGHVTPHQRKLHIEQNKTYLMAKPLWNALETLSTMPENSPTYPPGEMRHWIGDILEPQEILSLQMHEIILDRMAERCRYLQRSLERESQEEFREQGAEEISQSARDFAIAARRLNRLKIDCGQLCRKIGLRVFHEPGQGRG